MKTTKRIASQAYATSEQQLAGFIKKFDSKKRSIDPFSARGFARASANRQ